MGNTNRLAGEVMRFRVAFLASCVLAVGLLTVALAAQTLEDYSAPAAAPSGAQSAASSLTQGPFGGSVPEGKATSEVLPLSFSEAIDRGLRNNLGLLLQSDNSLAARGQRWTELSNLLPNVSAGLTANVLQTNLQAEGLRFPGFPTIIGPYGFFDARVYLKQSLVDIHSFDRERGAAVNEKAAAYSYQDARNMVVLAVGNAYLVSLAGAARVETAQAQDQTAQALYDKASDQLKAGVIPAIDALRAQVELQARHQQLISARNDYAKQKLTLARVIGLPPGQEFKLTEQAPYAPFVPMGIEQSLQRAYATRPDYLAATQKVRAAEYFRKATTAEYFPSLGISADYGDIGINPNNSHGTFTASGTLRIPIFLGGKVHADALQGDAALHQARQQLEDLRGNIDFQVRTALLDLSSAADEVEVARSSVDLAQQTLTQAKDRFSAGVTDNLELIQAQEALASANENYISSLYAHNVAKIALVYSMGYAEQGVKQYLQAR
jgi:outer membrane protein TolC